MRMRFALVCVALLTIAQTARADHRDVAREEFKTGARYFEIADYPRALEHFKTAYVAFEDPAILFNIAQCERLLNHKPEALRAYRIYLQKKPDSPNRADIENIIATLQDAINKDQKATTMPPVGVEGQKPADENPPVPAPETPPPAVTTPPPSPPPAATAANTPPPAPEKPIYKRWWLWAAAGAVVVAAVAVGVGVGVASNSHPDFKPTGPEIGPGATSAALVIAGRF
jgi:tetratricopeptide (TPR) repeat protein